jgi:4'-phosphopantetheinyl transferase
MRDFDKIVCQSIDVIGWGDANQIFNKSCLNIFLIDIDHQLSHLDDLFSLLSEYEKEASKKYRLIRDRQKFIVSKAIRRNILSKYLELDPQTLSFFINDFKKPYIISEEALYFSVSYSGQYIAMAFHSKEIGLDIEILSNLFDYETILGQVFSKDERLSINEAPERTKQFYTLWTRKEALIKATSQGIDDYFTDIPSLTGIHYLPKSILHKNLDYVISTAIVHDNILLSIAFSSNGEVTPNKINLYNWSNILTN